MPSITITIADDPATPGRAAVVTTDAQEPRLGRVLSPAEALAVDLLRTCRAQAREISYGPQSNRLVALARDLLDPERFGHAANREIREAAARALGVTQ